MDTNIFQHKVILMTKKSTQVDFLIKFFRSKMIICTQAESLNIDKSSLSASTILMVDFQTNHLELISEYMNQLNRNFPFPPVFGLFNIEQDYNTENLVKLSNLKNFKFCFPNNISEKQLLMGISAVAQGDYWLPRQLLNAIVRRLHYSNNDATPSLQSTNLTKKEQVILSLISEGYSNSRIADSQLVTIHTVRRHVYNIFKKINVNNRVQAVQWLNSMHQN